MISHLSIVGYGTMVGISGDCIEVREDSRIQSYPLNRVKCVQIAKRGISLSSDFIQKCSARGIRIFINDNRGQIQSCISNSSQHAVVSVRKAQFSAIDSNHCKHIAVALIIGKIKNQRATLLYFGKYHKQHAQSINNAAEQLQNIAHTVKQRDWHNTEDWRNILLGHEGAAARLYWQCLRNSQLLNQDFTARLGRQGRDSTNMALNYGYAILTTYIWNAVLNAGLEPYAGFYHQPRAGKPSLILDLMEEYRPWVVDRVIIKHKTKLLGQDSLSLDTRKAIISQIHKTFATALPYKGKKMRLESIMQRRVYQLIGALRDNTPYKPYLFKW